MYWGITMAALNKMLIQLKKINGLKDLSLLSDEQVNQQAVAGNKDFILELLRRADAREIEGDYLMACELYKSFAKGFV